MKKPFNPTTTIPQTSPPWWCRLPLLVAWYLWILPIGRRQPIPVKLPITLPNKKSNMYDLMTMSSINYCEKEIHRNSVL